MSGTILRLFFFFFFFFLFSLCSATDHIVGANLGWNPNINYTLWANNHTFYLNDMISFRYQKTTYNVFQVNRTGYDNCTTDGAFGNWSSGKDFVLLNKIGWWYFICGNYGCQSGMKVAVHVVSLSPPPSSAVSADKNKNDAGVVFRYGVAVWTAVLSSLAVSVGWIWFGLGGI